jgi:hypothetical protein
LRTPVKIFLFDAPLARYLEVADFDESEMSTLITFARYEIGFLLAALMAVVAYQFLTGRIITRGLLSEKTQAGIGPVSPSRVQLLLFTLAFAGYVLGQVVHSCAVDDRPKFPTVDAKWVLILAGSHSIFLGAKGVFSLFGSQSQQS